MGSVTLERGDHGCCTLSLDNQLRRNALDLAMITALQQHLAELAADPQCHVTVLRGRGEHFCAGRDISELGGEQRNVADIEHDLATLHALMLAVHDFPKPLFALVQGYALGLGAALVALCDIAYAAIDVRLGFPEVKVGMPPTLTTLALTRSVLPKHAMELLLSGTTIDGVEAARIGLVTRAVVAAELEAAFAAVATQIAAVSPYAVTGCKKLVREIAGLEFHAALNRTLDATRAGLVSPDAIACRKAFLARRNS